MLRQGSGPEGGETQKVRGQLPRRLNVKVPVSQADAISNDKLSLDQQ